jgi:uncharacterized protein (TIGR03083 family)
VNDRRAELADREAESWAAFQAALARIPRERWEEPGVVPGWSVKDLLWHVGGWLRECAGELEAIGEGRFTDEETNEVQTDARNAQLAAEARMMTVDDAWSGVIEARELVLRRWGELPEIGDAAIAELGLETWEHYEEHLPHLEAFAG